MEFKKYAPSKSAVEDTRSRSFVRARWHRTNRFYIAGHCAQASISTNRRSFPHLFHCIRCPDGDYYSDRQHCSLRRDVIRVSYTNIYLYIHIYFYIVLCQRKREKNCETSFFGPRKIQICQHACVQVSFTILSDFQNKLWLLDIAVKLSKNVLL